MREMLTQLFLEGEDFLADGRYDLAIKAYEKALSKAKKNDAEEFLALSYLGMAYDDSGDDKKALEYFKKSQGLASAVFGQLSPEHAVAINNHGAVHLHCNRLELAEPFLDAAIGILQASRGLGLSDEYEWPAGTVEVYSNAGDCKAKLGKFVFAIDHMQSALELAKITLGDDDTRSIQAAFELGALLAGLGEKDESLRLLDEVMKSEGVDPAAMMIAFHGAVGNVLEMLEGLEQSQSPPTKSSKNEKPAKSSKANSSKTKSQTSKTNSKTSKTNSSTTRTNSSKTTNAKVVKIKPSASKPTKLKPASKPTASKPTKIKPASKPTASKPTKIKPASKPTSKPASRPTTTKKSTNKKVSNVVSLVPRKK